MRSRRYTPLMFAVAYDRCDVVDKLVRSFVGGPGQTPGALDVQSSWGLSALMIAAITGNEECVNALVSHANLNIRDNDGCTALMHALVNRHAECAVALIDAGSDLAVESHYGHASLHLAIQAGMMPLVEHLIAAGASVNQLTRGRDVTPLDVATANDDSGTVGTLLRAGANPNHHDACASPLTTAAFRGNVVIFDMLMNAGANVNDPITTKGSCLSIAAYVGAGDIMRRALSAGATINTGRSFMYRFPRHFKPHLVMQGRHDEEENDQGVRRHSVYCNKAPTQFQISPYAIAGRMDDSSLLLLASGQDVSNIPYFKSGHVPNSISTIRQERKSSLQNLCREAIRGYMVAGSQDHTNLFQQVENLPLPRVMKNFLVYDQSLENSCELCAHVDRSRAAGAGQ